MCVHVYARTCICVGMYTYEGTIICISLIPRPSQLKDLVHNDCTWTCLYHSVSYNITMWTILQKIYMSMRDAASWVNVPCGAGRYTRAHVHTITHVQMQAKLTVLPNGGYTWSENGYTNLHDSQCRVDVHAGLKVIIKCTARWHHMICSPFSQQILVITSIFDVKIMG